MVTRAVWEEKWMWIMREGSRETPSTAWEVNRVDDNIPILQTSD